MSMAVFDHLFRENDEPKFVEAVKDYLQSGLHTKREATAKEYVARCRAVWQCCQRDAAYPVKILIDELAGPPEHPDRRPRDFSRVAEERNSTPSGEAVYCALYGFVTPDGTLLGVGPDYLPPDDAGVRKHVLAIPSDLETEEPEEPKLQPHVLAFFDVLGFKAKLADLGAEGILGLYRTLFEQTVDDTVSENRWDLRPEQFADGTSCAVMRWLPIRSAFFSDTLILWSPLHPAFFDGFLDRVMTFFCQALEIGVPLRGAVAAGQAILHKQTNIFIGEPLVEAASLETGQEWTGIVCGPSFREVSKQVLLRADQFLVYDAPMKAGKGDQASGIVLDWPRRWRDRTSEDIEEVLSRLRDASPTSSRQKYDEAIAFTRYSFEQRQYPYRPPPVSEEAAGAGGRPGEDLADSDVT
jgi:hypothetical protein